MQATPVLLIYIIITTKVRHDIRLSQISEENIVLFLGSRCLFAALSLIFICLKAPNGFSKKMTANFMADMIFGDMVVLSGCNYPELRLKDYGSAD